MPTLSAQLAAQDQNGNPLPAHLALLQLGPVIQVTASLHAPMAQQLSQAGKALPSPSSGMALIDTGASATCIDDTEAQQMGLPVINTIQVTSASHASHPANVYPVHLDIAGLPVGIEAPRAVGAALKAQGLLVLIGRDLLQHCVLVYNGATGAFSLSL